MTSATGAATPRTRPFRTIQVYPKDLRALPGHPEPAVSWHSGFRGGAHAPSPEDSVNVLTAFRRGRVTWQATSDDGNSLSRSAARRPRARSRRARSGPRCLWSFVIGGLELFHQLCEKRPCSGAEMVDVS